MKQFTITLAKSVEYNSKFLVAETLRHRKTISQNQLNV
jgi:hypothetical protein